MHVLTIGKVAGQVVQNLLPRFNEKVIVGWKLNKISPFALLVILWNTYDQAFASGAFHTVKTSNMIFIVFISVALFLVFITVSFVTSILWLSKEDTISVCYCVPAKTPAMGVPLIMTMFVGLTPVLEAKLQIPMVIFQGLQILGGTIFIHPFRRWVSNGKPNVEVEKQDPK
jgi:solute carrier family 10 (sodium/bile acid cotransporter), member 7